MTRTDPRAAFSSLFSVRHLVADDWPSIARIERACVAEPLGYDRLIRQVQQDNALPFVVAGPLDIAVAFMFYRRHHSHFEIRSIAVYPSYRRQGHGLALVKMLKLKMDPGKRDRITALVPERAVDAQLFFRAAGMACVHTFAERFGHDAGYLFECRFDDDKGASI